MHNINHLYVTVTSKSNNTVLLDNGLYLIYWCNFYSTIWWVAQNVENVPKQNIGNADAQIIVNKTLISNIIISNIIYNIADYWYFFTEVCPVVLFIKNVGIHICEPCRSNTCRYVKFSLISCWSKWIDRRICTCRNRSSLSLCCVWSVPGTSRCRSPPAGPTKASHTLVHMREALWICLTGKEKHTIKYCTTEYRDAYRDNLLWTFAVQRYRI